MTTAWPCSSYYGSQGDAAAYRAACKCWPGAAITLRRGTEVIEDNRRVRTA